MRRYDGLGKLDIMDIKGIMGVMGIMCIMDIFIGSKLLGSSILASAAAGGSS